MPDGLGEALPVPVALSQILGGPEDDIFDDIFDWIQNAISVITSTVISWVNAAWSALSTTITTWVTWIWDSIYPWLLSIWDWILSARDMVVSWVSTKAGELWGWINTSFNTITANIGAWFWEQYSQISALFSSWGDNIAAFFAYQAELIGSYWSQWFKQRVEDLTEMQSWMVENIVGPLTTWWAELLDRLLDVGSWIGSLMDGLVAWFSEDVPGSSPRWTGIFEAIGDWFYSWFFEFPKWMFENFPARAAYGISESMKWVGEMFNEIFETFMDAIMGLVRQIGPTNPSTAVSSYSAMAKVGLLSLGALAGMTVAGETLNPISHLGLGHISAMIYDMTNYKLITGVFMGALTFAMLKMPLTYYFNDIFRPYILPQRDFTELMSRRAFTDPELLQNPELSSAVQSLTGGQGSAWESRMIGFYGYPPQYHGLYSELANARLGYFALAGIARTGFWDETWFIEALARTGYSVTARDALLVMYKEQVKYARQQPVMYHLRRLAREGYYTIDQVKVVLSEVNAMEELDEIRLRAMALEQEYETFDMALDISLRAFSRGVIRESECRSNLSGLNVPSDLIDVHLAREKLGIIRRITWAPPEAVTPQQYVED